MMTIERRDSLILSFANVIARFDKAGDVVQRDETFRDALHVACLGRSVNAGTRALRAAVKLAKKAV